MRLARLLRQTKLLLCLLLLTPLSAYAAPKSDLWDFWSDHNAQSTQKVDHSQWQALLTQYVKTEGEQTYFRYGDLRGQDRQALTEYLNRLTSLDPRDLNRAEQFAYWVNLYNALTVNLIVDNYPLKSITKLGGLFSFGPWDQDITQVAGKTLTLNDIEHRILRPIWQDYRIHYAVNCASIGCPNLSATAITADNTEAWLTTAESEFVASQKAMSIQKGKTVISSIFVWYQEDWGGREQVKRYLSEKRPELAKQNGDWDDAYDWDLNVWPKTQ